jgi:hypothetical protein
MIIRLANTLELAFRAECSPADPLLSIAPPAIYPPFATLISLKIITVGDIFNKHCFSANFRYRFFMKGIPNTQENTGYSLWKPVLKNTQNKRLFSPHKSDNMHFIRILMLSSVLNLTKPGHVDIFLKII